MLKRWNQYGSETDVFDKYREAVRKSNRASIRIFGMADIAMFFFQGQGRQQRRALFQEPAERDARLHARSPERQAGT